MIVFWAGTAALTAVAVLFVAWPWINRRLNVSHTDSQILNTRITRQRLAELQREVREGLIDEQDRQQAEQELKLALAQEQSTQEPIRPGRAGAALTIGLLLALLIAGGSYWHANEIGALEQWQQANSNLAELGKRVVVDADPSVTADELRQFALALRTRLWREPDAPEGWLLLGRLHASLNRLDSAIEAYEKSLTLAPDREGTKMSLAQALVMTATEVNLQRATAILQNLIADDDTHHSAIGLLAIAATQLGQQQLALESWRRLQHQLPEDDPMYASVQQRIAALDTDGGTELELAISLAPELAASLPQEGYLIVFARGAERGKMPAAVIRQPLGKMPLTLRLSDRNAMVSDYRLSDLNQAQLVARISADADVSARSGELEGDVSIDIEAGTVMQQAIVIDRKIE